MTEFDDRQAVLHALRTANDQVRVGRRTSVSSARLFEMLPRCLRERWSFNYLRDVVLRDLTDKGLIEVQQVGPSQLHYRTTMAGDRYADALTAPPEPERLSAA